MLSAMAGGEGIVWLSRLLDALPLITHDHPVWTGAIHRLLDEFGRDHRRRDGGGHVIGQSALPQTAPSWKEPNHCRNGAKHMFIGDPSQGSGAVLDQGICVSGSFLG